MKDQKDILMEEAKAGDATSQCLLGIYYKEDDYEQAIYWFQKAVLNGNEMAELLLDETKKQLGIFQKANNGDMEAQFKLGQYYYDRALVEKKYYERAVLWYKKSADQGYSLAQACLGDCYCKGKGVEQDYKEAIAWYKKAADQGSNKARVCLGDCYREGKGVEQDNKEAITWYKKAADQGYGSAQARLGDCYYNGIGINQNYEQAVCWYKKAAEAWHIKAQVMLAECYYQGIGVEQNYQEAYDLLKDIIINDKKEITDNLVCLYAELSIVLNLDLNEVYNFLEQTINRRYSCSRYFTLIKLGKLIDKDTKKYEKLYKKSIKYASEKEREYYLNNPNEFMMHNN